MPCSSAELLQAEATEPDQVFRMGYIHFAYYNFFHLHIRFFRKITNVQALL